MLISGKKKNHWYISYTDENSVQLFIQLNSFL